MADDIPSDSDVSLWELIYLGYSLCYLRQAKQNELISSKPDGTFGIYGHILNWLEWIERLRFERSDRKVRPRLQQFVEQLAKALESDPQAVLGDRVFELRAILTDLYLTIESEARERTSFVVLPARKIPVENLLRKPNDYFGLTVDSPLDTPQEALTDFREAARCYAPGFSAAAIVFTFRGTEAILRIYFEKVTGQKPGKRAGWGTLLERLDKGKHNCPSELLRCLSDLKDWRNRVMHAGIREPEYWNDAAAQTAIWKCQEAVMHMNGDLARRLALLSGEH